MPDKKKCQRCEEPAKPARLETSLIGRLTGTITIRTYTIRWQSVVTRWMARSSGESVRITHSEMILCDECWGELLSWATQPEQERLKIAAANRLNIRRKEEVAEDRREREVQRVIDEIRSER